MKILCVAHVFYPEFWPELADCIRNVDIEKKTVTVYLMPGLV